MKILFFGDSITDMCRDRNVDGYPQSFGAGYPFIVNSKLSEKNPNTHTLINRGISGNKTVDLYARLKGDVWNLQPDVLSILIGVNDIWHEIECGNGIELKRFEKTYRNIIEETKEQLPNIKIMLLEPFVLRGTATDGKDEHFTEVKEYSKAIKKIAEDFGAEFVPIQSKLDECAQKYGADKILWDGVHPTVAGSTIIANEWLKVFKNKVER